MTSKKFFYIMIATLSVSVLGVIGIVAGGDILLHHQADKLTNLKLQNKVIEQQQMSLLQAKRDVEKYSDLDKIARQIIPQDKDQARATREILSIAAASGVKLSSISFPASTLGQSKAPTTPVQPDNTKKSDSTTATPATPVAPSVTQVKPVDGIPNLYQLDVVLTTDPANPVTYPKLISFLQRLEQNRRTAQVTQIAITPDSKNRSALNVTVTLTLYIKP